MTITNTVTSEAPSGVGIEVAGPDHHNSQSVSRDQRISSFVVTLPLDSSVNAADRQSVRFVEMGVWFVVLALSIFDDDLVARIIGVNRQEAPKAAATGIPPQPVEAMLPQTTLTENLIA
ncbi:MAG: hypothetical protein WEB00_10220 [Dehalococcoidia bacterium]